MTNKITVGIIKARGLAAKDLNGFSGLALNYRYRFVVYLFRSVDRLVASRYVRSIQNRVERERCICEPCMLAKRHGSGGSQLDGKWYIVESPPPVINH
jgi:hypothetical protein